MSNKPLKKRAAQLLKRYPPAYIVAGCNCGDEMTLPTRYAKAAKIPIFSPKLFITTHTGRKLYANTL